MLCNNHFFPVSRNAEKEKDAGNQCYKSKNYDEAITHYTKAIGE